MLAKKDCVVYTAKIFIICILFTLLLGLLAFWEGLLTNVQPHHMTLTVQPSARMVLDAGHGGRDGGAVSASGISEKDINLAVTRAMYDYLTLCCVETVMTRTEDSLVCDETDPALKGKLKMTDLKNRLIIAESNPDAIFVSIHMNKFSVEKYSGLQVYFSKNDETSVTLAQGVQEHVRGILQSDNTRKVKAAGSNIFLLDRIESPAILVECGFLSNTAEAAKLASAAYQTQLAVVIADSLLAN